MRLPTRLEQTLERLAVVEERIDLLRARLSRLRARRPGIRLDEFERALSLLIDSRDVLLACAAAISEPQATPAMDRASWQEARPPRHDLGAAEVAVRDPESVRHWCSVFGCNEAELLHAVWKAGPRASAVDAYLAERTERACGTPGG